MDQNNNVQEVKVEKKDERTTADKIVGYLLLYGVFIAGYKTGVYINDRRIAKGFSVICKADPSLEEHFWSAVGETYKKRRRK